jgi:hypothetical protein
MLRCISWHLSLGSNRVRNIGQAHWEIAIKIFILWTFWKYACSPNTGSPSPCCQEGCRGRPDRPNCPRWRSRNQPVSWSSKPSECNEYAPDRDPNCGSSGWCWRYVVDPQDRSVWANGASVSTRV